MITMTTMMAHDSISTVSSESSSSSFASHEIMKQQGSSTADAVPRENVSINYFLDGSIDDVIATDDDEYVSDALTNQIIVILTLFVTPCISVLGLVGNTFSIIILKKHGLKKCSDILLFSLAISDILFLVGANVNCISLLYHGDGAVPGFRTSYHGAYALYLLQNACEIMDWGGGSVSFTIPVLITVERLVAVFLPLKFPQIVTRKRTTVAVCCVFVLWYSLLTYTRIWFQFEFNDLNPYNISVGFIGRSDVYHSQPHVSRGIQSFIIYVSFTLPIPFVVTGCVIIGVKVKLAAAKRAQMSITTTTNSNSNTTSSSRCGGDKNLEANRKIHAMSRTTKTLISVCTVYSVAALFTNLPQYMPQFFVYGLFEDPPNNLARLIYQIMYVPLALNSSCNFLIYVVTNKKFRDTQLEILTDCCSLCMGARK